MPAFIDAACECGEMIGWFGRMSDRPPCPKCGMVINQTDADHDQKEIDDFAEFLVAKNSPGKGNKLRVMRGAVGLDLKQAGELVNMGVAELSKIEMAGDDVAHDVFLFIAAAYRNHESNRKV